MTRPHPGDDQAATGHRLAAVAHVWGRHLTALESTALAHMAAHAVTVHGVPVWRRDAHALAAALGHAPGTNTGRNAAQHAVLALTRKEAISPAPLSHTRARSEYALNLTGGAAWIATSPAPAATWAPVRSSTTTAAEAAHAEAEHAAAEAEALAAVVAPEDAQDATAQAATLRRRADALRPAADAARAALAARLNAETPAAR